MYYYFTMKYNDLFTTDKNKIENIIHIAELECISKQVLLDESIFQKRVSIIELQKCIF